MNKRQRLTMLKQAGRNQVSSLELRLVDPPSLEEDMADIGVAIFEHFQQPVQHEYREDVYAEV